MGIVPEPLGIVPSPRAPTTVKLSNYGMGDNYAMAHGNALLQLKGITKLDLSDNRLTSSGVISLLKSLTSQIYQLDLTNNMIGTEAVKKLAEILDDPNYNISHLYLKKTGITDKDVVLICNAIKYNATLEYLDLGYNEISDRGAICFGNLLSQNQSLKGISLAWNQIRGDGAKAVAEGIRDNNTLEVADLSWNCFASGNRTVDTPVDALCDMFIKNNTLIHLDLSHNNFSKDDLDRINIALTQNHILIGIHLEGEMCSVDAQVYVQPWELGEKKDNRAKEIYWSSDTRNKPLWDVIPNDCFRDNTHCWICGGWRPYTIVYTPGKSGPKAEEIRICFSFDSIYYILNLTSLFYD